MERCDSGGCKGHLTVVGTGPGADDLLTPRARQRIENAEIIAGYKTYLELIKTVLSPAQKVLSSAMMQEVDRCRAAIEEAASGRKVALVCGGDPGIYAMAGLVFELCRKREKSGLAVPDVEIIPGIPALSACAAVLGAPLMHDFAAISLSDLLTPWELIEKRLHAAASADFVIVLYNPRSKRRSGHLDKACEIIMKYRPGDTPSGVVSAATREAESVVLTTLSGVTDSDAGMQSTVIVGNSSTFVWNQKMVTPRGYGGKYSLDA